MSGDEVVVRRVRREELPALAEALVETSEAQLANRWREQELGYRELLVAEQRGAYVGTVSIGESESPPASLHLFALEVAPDRRGQGIGGSIVRYVVDEAARRLLEPTGWIAPDPEGYPLGDEIVVHYLDPLAATEALHGRIRYGHRVVAVVRAG